MFTNWFDRKILVLGFSKSGIAAAKYLNKHGADVFITEFKPEKEEDKTKILSEINDVQSKIKELRKYNKYCEDIFERSEIIQTNLNSFDKDIQKEKDNSRNM